APAGNEGPTVGAFGTIGSPGAAPAALAVAALDGAGPALPGIELGLATARGRAELDGALLGGGGGGRALRAPATPLDGPSQAAPPPGGAGLPVIGLTGDAASRALDLTGAPGGLAFVSAPKRRDSGRSLHPGRSSSRGPTYALAPKPDLAEPGTAETVSPTGGR